MSTIAIPLDDLYTPVATELAAVEQRFADELFSELPFVNGLCDRVTRFRGKMLRPALVLLSGSAAGKVTSEHITLSAVVEMVHMATLVHDDVLDAADIRRRHATINSMNGNETAVLLGDYLISHAFHLCSGLSSQFASRLIGATTNTVCEGELLQIHQRGNDQLSEEEYFEIIRRKTAALTATCCTVGAKYADADDELVERLTQFGMSAGVAFQIVDDVLDLIGTQREIGKTLGRDLDLGKPTLPIIHALAHGSSAARGELSRLLRNGRAASGVNVEQLLAETDSVPYALQTAERYTASAQQQLSSLPASPARDSLLAMSEFIVRRRA
ncbi:MAG TPA: polyprenyl synthetase family protein [Phycisphaerae bacterium]|jgi:octaprenyl-diphosphate synthase